MPVAYSQLKLAYSPSDPDDAVRLADLQAAGGYPAAGVGAEIDTGTLWVDGKPIYQTTFVEPEVIPGLGGTALGTIADLETVVRFEGYGNLADDGSGGTVQIGGSGFAATVRDDGEIVLTGREDVSLYKMRFTVWYTKV
jgi:hypothetical protein